MFNALISTEVAASASSDTEPERLSDAVFGLLTSLDPHAARTTADRAMARDVTGELTAQSLFDLQYNEDDLAFRIHAAAELTTALADNDEAAEIEAMLADEIARIRAEIAAQIEQSNAVQIGPTVTSAADVDHDVDAGAEQNLSSSWDCRSQALMFLLETDLSTESRDALDRADQAAAEAEAELELALDTALFASTSFQQRALAMTQAVADFEAKVRADARVHAMANTEFGDAGAAAMTEVLLQVHALVH